MVFTLPSKKNNRKVASNYLIEFRFHGYAKKYLKKKIFEVSKKFKVRGATKGRVVPHLTLFGPFKINKEEQVIETLNQICGKYSSVFFTLSGFDYFPKGLRRIFFNDKRIIFVEVEPSEELESLRWELSKKLREITYGYPKYDSEKKFHFHATIAFKDVDKKFDKIFNHLKEQEEKNINQCLLRVTLLRNKKILYEYDLIQKRLLDRKQAKSKTIWRKTIEKYKQTIESKN